MHKFYQKIFFRYLKRRGLYNVFLDEYKKQRKFPFNPYHFDNFVKYFSDIIDRSLIWSQTSQGGDFFCIEDKILRSFCLNCQRDAKIKKALMQVEKWRDK